MTFLPSGYRCKSPAVVTFTVLVDRTLHMVTTSDRVTIGQAQQTPGWTVGLWYRTRSFRRVGLLVLRPSQNCRLRYTCSGYQELKCWQVTPQRYKVQYVLFQRRSINPFQPKLILVHTTVTGTCRRAYKTCKNWPLCSYAG